MKTITPFFWFADQAEKAARFYVSVFERSKIQRVVRFGAAGPGKKGSVMMVEFSLRGQRFTALNGAPVMKPTNATSFYVSCQTQKEVDHFWSRLSKGGRVQQCGWLTDRFGVTWQIVPEALPRLIASKDAVKSERAMKAMMKMVKLDIKTLQDAYDGR